MRDALSTLSAAGLLAAGLAFALVGGAAGCSNPTACSDDSDCFQGEACSSGVCTALADLPDAGAEDADDERNDTASPAEDAAPNPDPPDTDGSDPDDTGDDPDDPDADSPQDDGGSDDPDDAGGGDTGPRDCTEIPYAEGFCEDDALENDDASGICVLNEDLKSDDDPTACSKSVGCAEDGSFSPVEEETISAKLCADDEEGDKFRIKYHDCEDFHSENFDRLVTVELEPTIACPSEMYELTAGRGCTDDFPHIHCDIADDGKSIDYVIETTDSAVTGQWVSFTVEPACEEPCEIDMPYELTYSIEEHGN